MSAESRAASVESEMPRPLQVTERRRDTDDTFTLHLRESSPRAFAPGQFNMLYVPGQGEVPISMSGDPERTDELVHTIRSVGAVTRALGRVSVGETVFVRGPFGIGWPEPSEGRVAVAIAGGIGLAPLRPWILRALGRNLPTVVLYGARSPADLLFTSDLAAWAKRSEVRVVVSVDRADSTWSGNTGVITKQIARLGLDPERVIASICGPEVMMRYAARELLGVGVRAQQIFVSLERNMKCAVGHCGHCQLGTHLLCRMGPVLDYAHAVKLLSVAEL
jgi:NAD(P)H-flavin reductase